MFPVQSFNSFNCFQNLSNHWYITRSVKHFVNHISTFPFNRNHRLYQRKCMSNNFSFNNNILQAEGFKIDVQVSYEALSKDADVDEKVSINSAGENPKHSVKYDKNFNCASSFRDISPFFITICVSKTPIAKILNQLRKKLKNNLKIEKFLG